MQSLNQLPFIRSIALSCLTAGLAPQIHAQTSATVSLPFIAAGKDGGMWGGVVVQSPRYAGARDTVLRAVPFVSYQWANGWFAGMDNGVGYAISASPHTHFGLRLTADFGRSESDDGALRGLGDVPARAEGGAFVNTTLGEQVQLGASMRHGSGHHRDGTVIDLSADCSGPLFGAWSWSAQAEASWANSAHLRSYFGVDAAQSTRSGYAPYAPNTGWRDATLGLGLTYTWGPRTHVIAQWSHHQLLGEAAHSPIVQARSSHSMTWVLAHTF